jgi:Rieske 2Fe-2S family protein
MAGGQHALPASWYLDGAALRRERERLLDCEWFCAGPADQLQRPGSLRVVEVAGESVLLVRTGAGELRAHDNVCRHRGSQVVGVSAQPAGRPPGRPGRRGRVAALPYHSWTYRLEGDLLRALERGDRRFRPGGLRAPPGRGGHLGRVRVRAPDPGRGGAPGRPARLRRYPLEALTVGRRLAYRVGPTGGWSPRTTTSATTAPASPEPCRVVPASSAAGPGWTGIGASRTARRLDLHGHRRQPPGAVPRPGRRRAHPPQGRAGLPFLDTARN